MKLRIGDKVALADSDNVLGRITDRGFTARNQGVPTNYDFGVNIAGYGMPVIAGFNTNELTKVDE